MDRPTYSLCEVVADLSWFLHRDLEAERVGHIEDSREVVRLVLEWAEEVETIHADREWDGEYFEAIDDFYAEKTKNL